MTTNGHATFTPNLVIGLGIAGLGIVLILDRLGMVAAQDILRFWPALLILFGASVMVQALRGRSDDARQRWIVSPGLILVIVVGSILFSHLAQRGSSAQGVTNTDRGSQFSVMGQSRRTITAAQFRGAELTSVMGTSSLDLRQTTIPPGEDAIIDVFAMMGQVELFVPDGWTVEVEAVPVMGAVKDRRFPRSSLRIDDQRPATATGDTPAPDTAASPRVVVRGFVMMGAVVVRS